MWKLNNRQRRLAFGIVLLYIILRILLYLLVGGYWGYIFIGIPDLIGFGILAFIYIIVYKEIKYRMNNKLIFYLIHIILIGAIAYFTMEDVDRILAQGPYYNYGENPNKSITDRIISTVLSMYNFVSFIVAMLVFILIDEKDHVFTYKNKSMNSDLLKDQD